MPSAPAASTQPTTRVGQVFEGEDVELLSTNLSVEDEEQVRAMLADD